MSLHWLIALQLRSFIACNTSPQLLLSVGGAVLACPSGMSLSVNRSDKDVNTACCRVAIVDLDGDECEQ